MCGVSSCWLYYVLRTSPCRFVSVSSLFAVSCALLSLTPIVAWLVPHVPVCYGRCVCVCVRNVCVCVCACVEPLKRMCVRFSLVCTGVFGAVDPICSRGCRVLLPLISFVRASPSRTILCLVWIVLTLYPRWGLKKENFRGIPQPCHHFGVSEPTRDSGMEICNGGRADDSESPRCRMPQRLRSVSDFTPYVHLALPVLGAPSMRERR